MDSRTSGGSSRSICGLVALVPGLVGDHGPVPISPAHRRGGAFKLDFPFAKLSDFSYNVRRATEQDPVEKEAKTDAELEDMILQRLVIGGVFVSVRRDPILGWRPTVVTAPRHTRNAQELADKIAADLRKKFTLKE